MIRDEKSAREWVKCHQPKPLEIMDEVYMLRAFYARTARKKLVRGYLDAASYLEGLTTTNSGMV